MGRSLLQRFNVARRRARRRLPEFKRERGDSPADVFSAIYRRGLWGAKDVSYYSGTGSHEAAMIEPYLAAVKSFFERHDDAQRIVDLGCGDFNVGSRLAHHSASFVACDVVPDLVERNQRAFADLPVDFVCVDIVTDPLPAGDVAFLRQVLQHLSNAQIIQIVKKLPDYRHVIVTEHVPSGEFVANRDHKTGHAVRAQNGSGVVLENPPFSMPFSSREEICRVQFSGSALITVAYTFEAQS